MTRTVVSRQFILAPGVVYTGESVVKSADLRLGIRGERPISRDADFE